MSPDPENATLIDKALTGDRNAFRKLVEKHQSFVYAVAYRMVNNKPDAEDIAQECFVRLWKNLPKYRPEVKLTTWLYKIITNLSLDFLKSRQRKHSKNELAIEKQFAVVDGRTADEEILAGELSEIIRKATETLTPKQKAVFILREVEGLSMEEISQILSMSTGNIKSNLYYARVRISSIIDFYYKECKREII